MRLRDDRVPVRSSISFIALFLSIFAANAVGQTVSGGGRNNPYSPSPTGRANSTVSIISSSSIANEGSRPAIAQRTYGITKEAAVASRPPTETYKVGVGDVLFVNVKNSPNGSGYCTVRTDGTIDFPLAGDNLVAADKPIDSIVSMLESGITLFPDPIIEVTIREYGSHKMTVSGMVDNPGEKSLQREAIPLYVVRADAVVDPKATKAIITRGPQLKVESYDLRDAETDNVLVYPGNSVEFTHELGSRNAVGYYYIGGEINSAGQKALSSGLTLYQAVVASGGLKGNPKKAVIRRKNGQGVLDIFEHNLRAIRGGKAADPTLSSGDIIEVGN